MSFSYLDVCTYSHLYNFTHVCVRVHDYVHIQCNLYGSRERRRSSRPTVEPSGQCCRGCCGDARGDVLTLRLGVGINYSYFVGASEQGTCQPTIPNVRPGVKQPNPTAPALAAAFRVRVFIDVRRRLTDNYLVGWFGDDEWVVGWRKAIAECGEGWMLLSSVASQAVAQTEGALLVSSSNAHCMLREEHNGDGVGDETKI